MDLKLIVIYSKQPPASSTAARVKGLSFWDLPSAEHLFLSKSMTPTSCGIFPPIRKNGRHQLPASCVSGASD